MTKREADVIGGLNMTDQISNEAYKQIMIAAQDENEVGDVLNKIKAEIVEYKDDKVIHYERNEMIDIVLGIIDKYMEGSEE